MANNTTQVLTGKDGKVLVGTDQIAYCDNWTMTLNQEVEEVLPLGTAWAGAQGGKKSASGSIGGSYSVADTAVSAIVTSWLGEGEVRADLHLVQNATKEFSGSVVLSSVDVNTPAGGKVTWTANFTFDGKPTEGTPE